MEIYVDKDESKFILVVTRDEFRRIHDAIGKIPINNRNEREMFNKMTEALE